ncbi:Cysteine-rich with EGF-like domain protein 1, partial [Stegodyphus mimosarum]
MKITRSKMYIPVILASILFKCFTLLIAVESPVPPKMENLEKIPFKGKPVPPCRACRNLVDSFLKAVDETMRKSFEGGDADWEKQKLGSYDNSELRFIEIQEQVCSDVGLGKDQCYNLAELHESELENWFYEERHKNMDLFEFLCISHLKICCPNNTYGSDCVPCPGGIESPCGGHGKCLKGGTREEPASCFCDAGYTGELCDVCAKGYYQEAGEVFSCKICDKACKGHCRGPGPKNCEVCSFGYHFIPDEGCVEHFNDYKNPIKITDDASNETEDP